jgi:hypothetical protein
MLGFSDERLKENEKEGEEVRELEERSGWQ